MSAMTDKKPINNEYIDNYYKVMGKTTLYSEPTAHFLLSFISAGRNSALISSNKVLRGVAKIKRMKNIRYATAEELSTQFFALQDAFALLAEKGIPVYFYNRVGQKKSGYQYRDSEQYRMKNGLSFPVMLQDIKKYEEQLKDIYGGSYSEEYVSAIGKISQVIQVGSVYQHEDCHSEYVNVENGKRVTLNQPDSYTRTIHVYGRCGAFGYAVEDKDTIPSLLQKSFAERGFSDIRVINHGLWGGVDAYLDHNFIQDAMGMKSGDIVLFYRKHFDKKLLQTFIDRGVCYKDITDAWHEKRNAQVTFFDKPGHMNAEGYKLVSEIICEDMIDSGFKAGDISPHISIGTAEHLNRYLKTRVSSDFETEVNEFTAAINRDYPLGNQPMLNGAIVMNCNPFTKGHRHLIETAAGQVDRLYIFVVEEDKSFFLFKDRFEMVKRGTADLDNVVVVPSGRFIISAYTFPEYFMKDYVKEKNFDVSMDVETFCKYIAPPLKIKKRFAGEEPFDPITRNYNENMAKILPEHGMEFVEIPRYAIDSERIVNATKVRELLKSKNLEELKEYVPESTYDILVKDYLK